MQMKFDQFKIYGNLTKKSVFKCRLRDHNLNEQCDLFSIFCGQRAVQLQKERQGKE